MPSESDRTPFRIVIERLSRDREATQKALLALEVAFSRLLNQIAIEDAAWVAKSALRRSL